MKKPALVIGLLLMSSVLSRADGLSTSFADVKVSNVPVGTSWNLKNATGSGLVLQNLGDRPLLVHVAVLVPEPAQLRDQAERLPSADWISVQPNDFELGPHEQKECEIVFTIPEKSAYHARFYQAMIFSRGAPVTKQGIRFGAGLLSRMRFRTRN